MNVFSGLFYVWKRFFIFFGWFSFVSFSCLFCTLFPVDKICKAQAQTNSMETIAHRHPPEQTFTQDFTNANLMYVVRILPMISFLQNMENRKQTGTWPTQLPIRPLTRRCLVLPRLETIAWFSNQINVCFQLLLVICFHILTSKATVRFMVTIKQARATLASTTPWIKSASCENILAMKEGKQQTTTDRRSSTTTTMAIPSYIKSLQW